MKTKILIKDYTNKILDIFCNRAPDEEWEKIRAVLTSFAEELLRNK